MYSKRHTSHVNKGTKLILLLNYTLAKLGQDFGKFLLAKLIMFAI